MGTSLGEITTSKGPLVVPERLLAVMAHPDDVDFGAAATIASLTDAGTHVSYCLVTSGDAGSDDLTLATDALVELREKEQTAAAAEVGVTDITFLRHPDGRVEASLALRRDIAAVIRRVKPDVVLCQSPVRLLERVFASHPDHLASGEATLCAAYPDARNPRSFPDLLAEGLEPHVVREVWLMAHAEPDLMIDVTEHFPRKIAALRAHTSQTARHPDLEGMIRTWLADGALRAGFPEGRLAESFKTVPTS